MVNTGYNEIIKLHNMLEQAGIGHEFRSWRNGYQIVYPSFEEWDRVLEAYNAYSRKTYIQKSARCVSVVENDWSRGHSIDQLEIMGMLTDDESVWDDTAIVSADDVFGRIMAAETEKNGEEN